MILRMLEFSKSLKASAGKSLVAGAVFYGAALMVVQQLMVVLLVVMPLVI